MLLSALGLVSLQALAVFAAVVPKADLLGDALSKRDTDVINTTSLVSDSADASSNFLPICLFPSVRVNFNSLTSYQKTAYFSAIQCLQAKPACLADAIKAGAKSRYDDMVWSHVAYGNFGALNDTWHVVGQFLHQHRLYMHAFETLLRSECGYTGPMAYWDESIDAASYNTSSVVLAHGGCGGSYGPHYITTGPFANLHGAWGPPLNSNIPDLSQWPSELTVPGPLWRYCVNYWGQWSNITSVRSLLKLPTFTQFRDTLFLSIHTAGHFGVGGKMGNGQASPADPIFFMHHMYLDARWWQWQQANPATRNYAIAGGEFIAESGRGASINMTLDTVLYTSYVVPNATVRDVASTTGGFLCYVYDGLTT